MDFTGKRVMVTGNEGFIGWALELALAHQSAEVWEYDILRGCDVLNHAQLRHFIEVNEIELVYHLAAQAHVPIANRYPFGTLQTNIMGTLNVLDICDQLKIPVIIASSDHAYGEAATGFMVDTPLNARYPYDVSKACADKIAQVYQERGADVKIMRLCNVYGPGDTGRHRLIPHVISSYLRGERPTLRGNPDMIREWIYIDDAVQAYIDAAGEQRNIIAVAGQRLSVGQVVECILSKMGGEIPVIRDNVRQEINNLVFAEAGHNLTPFSDGIDRTIAWWRETV